MPCLHIAPAATWCTAPRILQLCVSRNQSRSCVNSHRGALLFPDQYWGGQKNKTTFGLGCRWLRETAKLSLDLLLAHTAGLQLLIALQFPVFQPPSHLLSFLSPCDLPDLQAKLVSKPSCGPQCGLADLPAEGMNSCAASLCPAPATARRFAFWHFCHSQSLTHCSFRTLQWIPSGLKDLYAGPIDFYASS